MKFLVTGTAAFGPLTENSDLDIVMTYWESDKLRVILNELGIKYEDYGHINPEYPGIKFKIGELTLQIICTVNEEEFDKWFYATECMKGLEPIENREERIKTFQAYFRGEL